MNQRSFLQGAFVLMAAGLATRVLGFGYRIYLSRLIGAGGMGLFQMIWPLAGLALTFITAGLPTAISKLVAEAFVSKDKVRIQRILRISTTVIVTMSILITALMWFLRQFILHHWLTDPRAYMTYLAMIPIIMVIAIASIYKGYFQGLQDMSPPAWASIYETIARIAVVYVLAGYFVRYGVAYAAAAAMVGTVIGEVVGLAYIMFQHHRRGRLAIVLPDAPARSFETTKQTLRAIGEIAVPVTLSRLTWSLMSAIEPILVTKSLALAGIATVIATRMYGEYGSMAIPLLFFPTVFTGSLAVNLVPSVSEAVADDARRRIRVRMAQSFRATALVGFPTAVILTLYATPLCRVIYHDAAAGPILAVMAPAGFLFYLQSPLSGILQGLNRAGIAMINSIIAGIIRLGLIYVLASDMRLGILGVAWATTAAAVIGAGLYFFSVYKYIGFAVRVMDTAKIALAAIAMLILMKVISPNILHIPGGHMLAAICAGLMVYFFLCCSFRVITSNAVRRIPRIGHRLAQLVEAIPFSV